MPIEALHAALEATFAENDSSTQPEAPESPAEATEAPTETTEAQSAPSGEETTAQATGERPRAPDGKFAKAPVQPTPKAAPAHGKPAATAPQAGKAPPDAASAAPRTYGPVAREQWGALPRETRDQILKREGEFSRYRQEAEPAMQESRQLRQVLQPYMPHFQAAGVQPLRHINDMLRTDYALRSSPEPQKAATFAQLMEVYGISAEALDKELHRRAQGGAAPAQVAPPQQAQPPRDPRLDHLIAAQEQRRQATLQQEVEAFRNSPEAEYFEDVQDTMADIYEAYERAAARAESQGKQPPPRPSLPDVYRQALTFPQHAEIMRVLESRKAEEAKRAQNQKVTQARYAAGSVQTEPAPPTTGKRAGLGGMWDALERGLSGER